MLGPLPTSGARPDDHLSFQRATGRREMVCLTCGSLRGMHYVMIEHPKPYRKSHWCHHCGAVRIHLFSDSHSEVEWESVKHDWGASAVDLEQVLLDLDLARQEIRRLTQEIRSLHEGFNTGEWTRKWAARQNVMATELAVRSNPRAVTYPEGPQDDEPGPAEPEVLPPGMEHLQRLLDALEVAYISPPTHDEYGPLFVPTAQLAPEAPQGSLPPKVPVSTRGLNRALMLVGHFTQARVDPRPKTRQTLLDLIGAVPTPDEATVWKAGLKRLLKNREGRS